MNWLNGLEDDQRNDNKEHKEELYEDEGDDNNRTCQPNNTNI